LGLAAHDLGHLLPDDGQKLLGWREGFHEPFTHCSFPHPRQKLGHNGMVHVRSEQNFPDFPEALVHIGLGEEALSAQALKNLSKTIG
jgi:hypothetical protein